MDKSRCQVSLERCETQFRLWRLSEEEYHQLRQHSLPIKEDGFFLLQLFLSERQNPNRLTLPKAFLTLEHLLGQSSDFLDNWKGSFNFPLLLVLKKPAGQFFYLFRVHDHRGSLCFPLYRILENGVSGYDLNICREPFELEFSRKEINEFLCYFYGYLSGSAEAVSRLPRLPFLKRVESDLILYGYKEGDFFEEQMNSEGEYRAAIQRFEEVYGSLEIEEKSRDIQPLLKQIVGEI